MCSRGTPRQLSTGFGGAYRGVWISLSALFLLVSSAIAQQGDPAVDQVDSQSSRNGTTGNKTTYVATDDPGGEVVPSEVEQRELGADENPMATANAQREVQREEQAEGLPERTTGFDIYGSVRIRYRKQGSESGLQDGSSRMGVAAEWQYKQGSYLIGRYEWGFNVLTGIDPEKSIGELEDTVFTRLLYLGLDTPQTNLVLGKNWSTYYEVAAFTDRFEGAGGKGTGTYNAFTDGGETGTGRADGTLQGKLSTDFLPHRVFKPFDINLQVQNGNSIPFGDGAEYGTAVGASAVMTTQDNFTLGLAYNYASIDLDENPGLRDIGITGPARAMLAGTRAFGERWYAGLTVARLENHESTEEGIYFDGWGSEFYGQYQATDRVWLVGGYNVLEPDSDQVQAGDFRIRYAVLGVRYSFEDFRRMLWANVRINEGLNADGTRRPNVYTIGIRWDLSKRGWHMSQ